MYLAFSIYTSFSFLTQPGCRWSGVIISRWATGSGKRIVTSGVNVARPPGEKASSNEDGFVGQFFMTECIPFRTNGVLGCWNLPFMTRFHSYDLTSGS